MGTFGRMVRSAITWLSSTRGKLLSTGSDIDRLLEKSRNDKNRWESERQRYKETQQKLGRQIQELEQTLTCHELIDFLKPDPRRSASCAATAQKINQEWAEKGCSHRHQKTNREWAEVLFPESPEGMMLSDFSAITGGYGVDGSLMIMCQYCFKTATIPAHVVQTLPKNSNIGGSPTSLNSFWSSFIDAWVYDRVRFGPKHYPEDYKEQPHADIQFRS